MGSAYKVVAGIGALIALFLIVTNGTKVAGIIQAIASNSIDGIKTLQGR